MKTLGIMIKCVFVLKGGKFLNRRGRSVYESDLHFTDPRFMCPNLKDSY